MRGDDEDSRPGESVWQRMEREQDSYSSPMAQANGTRGQRPFVERWTYCFLLTAWAWVQVIFAVFDVVRGEEISGLGWFAIAILPVVVPAFAWSRRREERKRLAP